jgi:hypothetical protein
METILALDAAGVPADRLAVEYLAPSLRGGKLDLVVDPPNGDVIELKYPRDSRTKFSPDTMTMGEMVRDFLRVAGMPARSRWVVQVVNPRLERYLIGLDPRHQLRWAVAEGSSLVLHPEVLARLPKTAREAMHDSGTAEVMDMQVTATCIVAVPIDSDLSLYAYAVDAPSTPSLLAQPPVGSRTATTGVDRKSSARAEILAAISDLNARSGADTVTLDQVVREMRTRGSQYAESTVRTMVTSHMCADATGPGISPFTDLERVDRGVYRLRRP